MDEQESLIARESDGFGDEQTVQEPVKQLIPFRLGAEWYGLYITRVREVLPVGRITYLPSCPAHIAGIVNVRGNILSVTDLSSLLNTPSDPPTQQNRIIVVEAAGVETGLRVDEAAEVALIPLSRFEPLFQTLDAKRAKYLESLCRWNERLVGVLRVDCLLGISESGQSV